MTKPGLHRSLLGNGISNVFSGAVGSPPNTTYGENIGVMAITKMYSVWVIRGAALFSIGFSLIGQGVKTAGCPRCMLPYLLAGVGAELG